MKALTVHQPWASLIALGHKRIETRSWSTSYRGPLAIHAAAYGRSVTRWGIDGTRTPIGSFVVRREGPVLWLVPPSCAPVLLPLGSVVATATLIDVVPIHEQFCGCQRGDLWIGHARGGMGRDVVNLYNGQPLTTMRSGVGVGSIDGGIAIHRANGNADRHPWVAAQGYRDWQDEAAYGEYACGRFAWLLDDIQPLDPPAPAKGRQGLWNWNREAAA